MPAKDTMMRQLRLSGLVLIFLAVACLCSCQQRPTTTFAAAKAPVRFIELNTVILDVLLDIRYATTNNFTGVAFRLPWMGVPAGPRHSL